MLIRPPARGRRSPSACGSGQPAVSGRLPPRTSRRVIGTTLDDSLDSGVDEGGNQPDISSCKVWSDGHGHRSLNTSVEWREILLAPSLLKDLAKGGEGGLARSAEEF